MNQEGDGKRRRETDGDRYVQQKVSAPVIRCARDSVLAASVLMLVNMMLLHLTEQGAVQGTTGGRRDGRRQRGVRSPLQKVTQTVRKHIAQQRLIGLFISTH